MVDAGNVMIEIGLMIVSVVLLCRWVFGTRGVRRRSHGPDYGLLTPVLRTDSRQAADVAAERLTAAGVRATVAPAGLGFTATGRQWPADAAVVLVFPHDVAAAEALLRPAASR